MLAKVLNVFLTPIRKNCCRSSSCGSACRCCASANRHSVLSCRRSPTRPTIALHSCAWQKPSQHSLLACAALPKRLVSSNARESCDSWLKTFCWAKIPSPFVTAFRFLRVRPKTEDRSPQTVKITFCVRGVLSPLLSNLVLDELDRELERRKHRFVRYADDCNIYVASERAGKRVMQSVTGFLTRRLKLKVNEAKSAVARPVERKFLGFSFSSNKEPKRRIAPKALLRCKQKIRELTQRTRGISLEQMTKELAAYLRGWKSYFGFCQTPSLLKALDKWIRHRLRSMIWKQWKRGPARYAKLRQLGIGKDLAAQTAGSPHGPWRLANSPALQYALPIAYFDALRLPRLFDGLA